MEREKMIEEMTTFLKCCNHLCDECDRAKQLSGVYGCIEFSISKTLYDAGYRKIPDGAVVLTKEELNEKYVMKEMYDLANACHDEKCAEFNLLSYKYYKLEEQLKQVRKETAREILNDISKAIKVKEDIYGREYQIIYEDEILKLKKKLKEKYGVEEEE